MSRIHSHIFNILAVLAMFGVSGCLAVISEDRRRAPDAPRGVQVTAQVGALEVAWSAPEDDGGVALTQYRARIVEDTTRFCVVPVQTLTCEIDGLSVEHAYTVVVQAANRLGFGKSSTPSEPVMPLMGLPDAPTQVVAVGGPHLLRVGWNAPVKTGGASQLVYHVGFSGDTAAVCQTEPNQRECVLEGLQPGTPYTVFVRASNAVGVGPAGWSVPSYARVLTPDAPYPRTATPGNGSVLLAWDPPTYRGVDTGLVYLVSALGDTVTLCETATTSCTIDNLQNWLPHRFTIRARNVAGISVPSDATTPAVPLPLNGWTRVTVQNPNGTGLLYSAIWTGSAYVAVGSNGILQTSPDAVVWTNRTSGSISATYWDVAFGNGVIAVVGSNSTILTSLNGGLTWTSRSLPNTGLVLRRVIWAPHAVAPGQGRFLAVGSSGSTSHVVTSQDGITWSMTSSMPGELWSIGWVPPEDSTQTAQGRYIATGVGGVLYTSTNAQGWTNVTTATGNRLDGSAWGRPAGTGGDGVYVVVGANGVILRSTNRGVTWSHVDWMTAEVAPMQLTTVLWTGEYFLAVGYGGTVLASTDGLAWNRRRIPQSDYLRALSLAPGGRILTTGYSPPEVFLSL